MPRVAARQIMRMYCAHVASKTARLKLWSHAPRQDARPKLRISTNTTNLLARRVATPTGRRKLQSVSVSAAAKTTLDVPAETSIEGRTLTVHYLRRDKALQVHRLMWFTACLDATNDLDTRCKRQKHDVQSRGSALCSHRNRLPSRMMP